MNAIHRCILLASFVLGGCVAQPVIDPKGFAPPKSAVLLDIPKMHVPAVVGVIVPWAPGFPWFHFSERADYYFLAGTPQGPAAADHQSAIGQQMQQQISNTPKPMPMGQLVGASLAGAAIGAIIQSNADDTYRKSQTFHADLLKLFPDYDLRADFMGALVKALQARGVAVTVAGTTAEAPRLRWPAVDAEKNRFPSGSSDSFPAVDADVLVQVSPIAFFMAPGPLNAYKRSASVGLALYNGRTREFLGRQNIWFSAPDGRMEYSRYDSLVADLPAAAPALREALLSLVPKVADAVAGRADVAPRR